MWLINYTSLSTIIYTVYCNIQYILCIDLSAWTTVTITVISVSPVLCAECVCDYRGTVREVCDAAGRCLCRQGVEGTYCERCWPGHHSFPLCRRQGERDVLLTTSAATF